jgi:release factor glutamine methyltransferase
MTYRDALHYGERLLREAGTGAGDNDAMNDAWWLMEMVCRFDRSSYYAHMAEEMPDDLRLEYEMTLAKRAEHVPLQYIVGETEFMGLKFKLNSSVLIPRQDTETLAEEAIKVTRPGMRILDLGTGSGCVAISILHNVKGAEGLATDISKQALLVAKENARLNGVKLMFERSDLFDNVSGTFDVIVSNPPYIRSGEIPKLMPEVRSFEPREALDGGEDGLVFYRRIIDSAKKYMNPQGHILCEIGFDQGQEVSSLLEDAGFGDVRVVKDLAHNDRVVCGRAD